MDMKAVYEAVDEFHKIHGVMPSKILIHPADGQAFCAQFENLESVDDSTVPDGLFARGRSCDWFMDIDVPRGSVKLVA